MGIIDAAIFIIILALGFLTANRFGVTPRNRRILQWLWAYHLLFGIIFWIFIVYGPGGDAKGYWGIARVISLSELDSSLWSEPTSFVIALCIPLAGILKLSFFSTSMIFCLVGYVGMAAAFATYERLIPYNAKIGKLKLFPFIFFLPNLHFWSSGVGKDTLVFLCITLFFFCLTKPKKYWGWIIFCLVLSYFVRPHITLFLIMGLGVGFVLDGRIRVFHKLCLMVVMLFCGAFLFNRMESFLKIEEINVENITRFSQTRAEGLSRESVGSAIDINSYPLPLKIFTFLFRPLFFDARSLLAIVASFENLLLLAICVRVFASKPVTAFKQANYIIKAAIIFAIIGAVGCSMITSNLGIILRQKNMFIPALYLFIGWTLALRNKPPDRPQPPQITQ